MAVAGRKVATSLSASVQTGRRPHELATTAVAACYHLGPSAVLSYRAAAVLQGLSGFKRARVEVTVPPDRNRSGRHRIKIHLQQDPTPPEDITTVDGIPVTKPARTLLDLATVEGEDVIERCLDDLLRRRLVSLPFLEKWLNEPRTKRHRGARVLQKLVDARATVGVTESPLETQLLKLLREEGLPIRCCSTSWKRTDASSRASISPIQSNALLSASGTTTGARGSTQNAHVEMRSRPRAGACSASPRLTFYGTPPASFRGSVELLT